MLVLIIIFMITAPMLNVGVPVDLPKTRAATLEEAKSSPIVITIDKDSQIYVEEANVTIAELLQKLPMLVENGKTDTVYVRGDKDLPYGQIMKIMGIVAAAGAYKVSLLAESATASDIQDVISKHTKQAPASLPKMDKKETKPANRRSRKGR
jgi:biopolymer transport protein TolR